MKTHVHIDDDYILVQTMISVRHQYSLFIALAMILKTTCTIDDDYILVQTMISAIIFIAL